MRRASPSPAGEPTGANTDLVDALAQLSFLVQGVLAKYAASQDLSMIQVRLLGVLRDREPTMQELAKLLGLDKSSVTGLVARAEKRSLVQRTPSGEDRRAVHVSLTAKGRRTVAAAVAALEADIALMTASLSSADQSRLSRLATRIIAGHADSPSTGMRTSRL
jgi:MarR family transcriptional regulator, lower aerobic nicotinate degradation pathway regulator